MGVIRNGDTATISGLDDYRFTNDYEQIGCFDKEPGWYMIITDYYSEEPVYYDAKTDNFISPYQEMPIEGYQVLCYRPLDDEEIELYDLPDYKDGEIVYVRLDQHEIYNSPLDKEDIRILSKLMSLRLYSDIWCKEQKICVYIEGDQFWHTYFITCPKNRLEKISPGFCERFGKYFYHPTDHAGDFVYCEDENGRMISELCFLDYTDENLGSLGRSDYHE